MVCLSGSDLVGVITILDQEKIDQLFVRKDFRGLGVATRLWQSAKKMCTKNPGLFWVRSSSVAIPVYKKFGFCVVSPEETFKGITFTRMELVV